MHGYLCKRHGTWPRREAYFASKQIPGSLFVPTESPHVKSMWENPGSGIPEVCKKLYKKGGNQDLRICSRGMQGRFTAGMYVDELRRSKWCLHFRGDTTTARRFFDSVAAGCVPVIVSDGVNLPFVDRLDWRSFTVQITEKDMTSGRDAVVAALTKLVNDEALLKEKQRALAVAARHLVFGYGNPMEMDPQSPFQSLVVDHILEEIPRANAKEGLYRRFPVTMAGCEYKKGAQKEADARLKADKGQGQGAGEAEAQQGAGVQQESAASDQKPAEEEHASDGARHKALSKGWKHIKAKTTHRDRREQ